MSENKYSLEPISEEVLQREAEEIRKELAQANLEEIPAGAKERVHKKLQAQMEEYEREQLYAKLSEEDRKALELGKELMKQQKEKEAEQKVVYHKKKRVYVALAAVLVMVLAMGITSVGGPEKMIQIVKSMVGDREVVKVNSDDDNKIIDEEGEEQAYQEIKDAFGVEPVKITFRSKNLYFDSFALDSELQVAELFYKLDGQKLVYFINVPFAASSWGVDVEDEIIDVYNFKKENTIIEVKEYETPETKERRYSAKFSYKGLEYFLIGTISRADFEYILKNLYFF